MLCSRRSVISYCGTHYIRIRSSKYHLNMQLCKLCQCEIGYSNNNVQYKQWHKRQTDGSRLKIFVVLMSVAFFVRDKFSHVFCFVSSLKESSLAFTQSLSFSVVSVASWYNTIVIYSHAVKTSLARKKSYSVHGNFARNPTHGSPPINKHRPFWASSVLCCLWWRGGKVY